MTTWIFQGSPKKFGMDTYFQRTSDVLWTVKQKHLAPDMKSGDRVFIWRSGGGAKAAPSGVVASGTITAEPSMREEDVASEGLWLDPEGAKMALRVEVRIDRVATPEQFIKREGLLKDPVLSQLRIFKLSVETNYRLTDDEATRLELLWGRTGDDHENDLDQAAAKLETSGAFDATDVRDAREKIERAIVLRRGQKKFRDQLLALYGGKCAITGCDVVDVLEAAHIIPYKGGETNHPANGVLLRADLHTLFDLGMIAIDSNTMTVLMSEALKGSEYGDLAGRQLRPPADDRFRPDTGALDTHRKESRIP